MIVEVLRQFEKDVDRIKSKSINRKILQIIEEIEAAERLSDISNLKKLNAGIDAFRIRIGDYRLGLYFKSNKVILARLIHRKDIYKVFP